MSSITNSSKEFTNINSEKYTAARIRPVSVEEILSRRKEKLNIDNGEGGAEETVTYTENNDNGNSSDKDTERKKSIECTVNENLKTHEERNAELGNNLYGSHDKFNINSEAKSELESNYSKSDVKKESKDVNQTPTGRTNDKSKGDGEKNLDYTAEKDTREEEKMPKKEHKRKYESHVHGKLKSVIEGSIPKRHDSGRLHDIEYSERKEQNLEYYKTWHGDPNRINDRSISKKHDSDRSYNVEYSDRKDRTTEHYRSRQEEQDHIDERNRPTNDAKSYDEYSERKDRRKQHYKTHHEESLCVDDKHRSAIDASLPKKHGSSRLSHDVEYSKKPQDNEYSERKTRKNESNRNQHKEPNQIDDKIKTVDRSITKKYDYGKTRDAEYLDKKERRSEHSLAYSEKTSYNDEKTKSKLNDFITEKHDSRSSRDTKYLEKLDQKRDDTRSHHEKREKIDHENKTKDDVSSKKIHDSHKESDTKNLERKEKKVENTRNHYEKTDSIDDKLPRLGERLPKINDSGKKSHESEKFHDIEYLERTNPKIESRSQLESRNDSSSRSKLKDEDSVKIHDAENSLSAKYAGEKDKRNENSQTSHENKNYSDDKIRSKGVASIPEKHESVRSHDDYLQRKGGTKEHSRTYNEEPDKRRSRSQEWNQERNEHDKSRKRQIEEDAYGRNYRNHGSGIGGYSPRKRKSDSTVKSPPRIIKRSPERKISTWDQPPNNKLVSMSSATITPPENPPQALPSFNITSIPINVLVDSVQLTQATRPMRSLYIENIPPSASEKSLIDRLNDFLMPSGVNGIQRAKPCISCIINKDKSQAVVEFLTPEDATSAICFDGRSMSGTVLKIRRPKDFVEATGTSEKTAPMIKKISEVVKDSPNKIFIGGISKSLSSEMFREVVGVFGLLRAYHFEFNQELNGPCAFLEYEDHTVTQKACAGLDGMKLGGCIITAAQAFLHFHGDEDDAENLTSYDVPVHAKSLLADPTQVLQLKNVINPAELSTLSDADFEELLEDVRLECTRFGTVKSINVVRPTAAANAVEFSEQQENYASESVNEDVRDTKEYKIPNHDVEEKLDSVAEISSWESEDQIAEEATELTVLRENESEVKVNGDGPSDNDNTNIELFEPGSIVVEFLRKEAACAAAHCLHLRYYGDRIVMASYVSHDLFVARFPK